MIRVTTCAGRRVAVFGLGASGVATARALAAGGVDVAAWDDGEGARAAAAAAGVPLVDLRDADWGTFASLVLAPGVPLTHPVPHWTVARARAAGVEIVGDIELFCRERAATAPDAPFIAITGTNGKSTTTALIAHILTGMGKDVQMGGNIGVPILALAPPARERYHVIEMSSFQIDLTPGIAPTVGVLLNVTPDHLDRHGTMEAYAAIKERLVARAGHAVIGEDDDWCMAIIDRRDAALGRADMDHTTPIAVSKPMQWGAYLEGRDLVYQRVRQAYTDASGRFVLPAPRATVRLDGIATLRGAHNAQNACAAYATLRALRLPHRAIADHLATYPGLPHRLEEVGHLATASGGRVLLVNDSKATNADSTEKALRAFPRDVHWILGGTPKEGGIDALRPLFDRVAAAYLIGAASEDFAAVLAAAGVPHTHCGTIDVAVRAAADAAAASGASGAESAAEPVVLLSPACASYDQFANFERRGDAFRAACHALPGFVARGRASASCGADSSGADAP
jgi:UDP-N-acetylmuramoylalanine--D-glutamate ligase